MSTLKATNLQHASATNPAIVLAADGTAAPVVSGINSGPLAGFRNAIINGSFEIAQRGTSISSGAGQLSYTLDRWIVAANTVAVSVNQSAQTTFPYNYLAIGGNTGNTGVSIRQRIEAKNIRDLAGKQVTLSFYIYNATSNASAITVQMDRANAEDNFAAVTNFHSVLLASTSNTNRQTVTVTLPAEARNGIEVRFVVDALTTGVFVLHTVQLEQGPVATPFERRPIGTELALCQRYFQLVKGGCGVAGTSTQYYGTAPLLAQMRAAPTLGKTSGNITIGDMISADFSSSSTPVVEWSENTTSLNYGLGGFTGLTVGRVYRHEPKSPGLALITCSAEL